MAQGAGAAVANGVHRKDEKWENSEYEKILRFRDQVLSGTHPRVKIPPNLVGKLNAAPRTVSSPSNPTRSTATLQATHSIPASSHDSAYSPNKAPDTQRAYPSRSAAANVSKSTTELDPIFLSKSEELVKAEIQLQRQRLERTLREQIEQRKIAAKLALQTSESLPDFDLSDVLYRALQRVQCFASADVENHTRVSDSDSFDENSFYSSQHDTPDNQSLVSQGQKEPGEVEVLDTVIVDQPSTHNGSAHNPPSEIARSGGPSKKQPANATLPDPKPVQSHRPRTQERYNLRSAGQRFDDLVILEDASTSAKESSNNTPGNNSLDPAHDSTDSNDAQQRHRRQISKTAHEPIPNALRHATHNLFPFAPQPEWVSPLLNEQALAGNHRTFPEQTHPAALHDVSVISSPEGAKESSKLKKRGDKKKRDKGRRNASKRAASPVPYIKTEPKSPSPFEPLFRPLKRQRQSFQNADGLDYDEPRRGRQQELYDDSLASPLHPRPRSAYDHEEPRNVSPRLIRRDRDDIDYRRIASVQYASRPQSPPPVRYSLPYSPTEVRPLSAASQAVFERPVRQPVRYYGEEQIPRREVIELDRERSRSPVLRERRTPLPMAPPRLVPERVVMDAHGRHYYAPAPMAEERYYPAATSVSTRFSVAPTARPREVVRYSVAPSGRGAEHEVLYERAPMRPPPEVINGDYEERRIVYRRPASPHLALAPPRRVASQTEREGTVDLRAYREREYSTRSTAMVPQEEYVQIRGAPERRQMSHYPEAPREYVSRVSMHPEPVRYEIPREYVGRLQSVRPEALGRDYAPSARPEPRREGIREASVRPGEHGMRREYGAPLALDGERYEYSRPVRRAVEEPIYIDGPREVGQDTLPGEARMEVYR